MKKVAADLDLKIVKIFAESKSAKKPDNRPQFSEMIKMLETRKSKRNYLLETGQACREIRLIAEKFNGFHNKESSKKFKPMKEDICLTTML